MSPNLGYGLTSLLIGAGLILSTSYVLLLYRKKKQTVPRTTLVNRDTKIALPLIKKKIINHDSRVFRFKLPSEKHILGLPIGKHVRLSANVNNELVSRAYTPVSSDENFGYVDLVIKVYFKDTHPHFPAGGKLTQYIENMAIGDTIDFSGPVGRLEYLGYGEFNAVYKGKEPPPIRLHAKKLSMIAGGSGIAPMLQLIRHITKHPEDDTKISLLFANRTEKDILLRDELERIAREHNDQFKVWYTVDLPTEDWKYSTGFISAEMIESHLFSAESDNLVLVCGPKPMIKIACLPNLEKLGFSEKQIFIY